MKYKIKLKIIYEDLFLCASDYTNIVTVKTIQIISKNVKIFEIPPPCDNHL